MSDAGPRRTIALTAAACDGARSTMRMRGANEGTVSEQRMMSIFDEEYLVLTREYLV
jgi:hypothetical protein